ncbi:hypothetical protein Zm00014a_008738 [Zea mays]|uniref:Uncharacterized protein n=1 Tax=Zea mays TaxID=4577 RepID=A0A3L6EAY6_MAIZE|nr:hypothetical protein Zm00014a_008738 [Zea mays]
MTLWLSVFV